LAILLGLAAGVVVNVLADDLPPDEAGQRRPLQRPHCQVCGLERPVETWLALAAWAGRCPYCAAPRGWRAPLVEAAAALGCAYVWIWAEGDLGRFLAGALVYLIFLLITVIDIEHRLILWRVVWISAIALALLGGLSPDRGWQKTLVGGLVGYGLVALLFLLGQGYALVQARLRGQPLDEVAFGGGDVNLAGLIGLAVGWSGVLLALFIGVVSAGLFSLGYVVIQLMRGRYNPHTPIPYGPFLVLGGLTIYWHGRDLAVWWLAGR
jgi:leader peptidase (prepilin peptidase)/N-methyltransferase